MSIVVRVPWGTSVERERRNRILVSIYAYAYECLDAALIPDAEYDKLALSINTNIETGDHELDVFFRESFSPHTGMWVHQHPHIARLHELCYRHFVR